MNWTLRRIVASWGNRQGKARRDIRSADKIREEQPWPRRDCTQFFGALCCALALVCGADGQGCRDHHDRNDRRRQCGRLALVYRHCERLFRRRRNNARHHLCADRVRPGAAALRGLARHRRRCRRGRADPCRGKRRAGRPSAHRRPGFGLRDDGQADYRDGEGSQRQDHLHRRPGRHQPRLSRAHHAGQRPERRRLRHYRRR